jgi:NADH-quinone oxidoreductase subunit N
MSAPLLWIFLPLILAGILMLVPNQKVIFLAASFFTLFLTLAAWLLPIDSSLTIRGWTFKLLPTVEILGRSMTLTSADRSFLALLYGSAFFWFIPAASLQIVRRLIPFGLAIISLLVAALAVEPTLYAALIIELAALVSIPMLKGPQERNSRGVIRFLTSYTLAVPFILFSGWQLSGITENPGEFGIVQQATILLGLGFAFLLAIFPFYSWIPMLAEEAHPYLIGFILWMLPTVTLFFGLGFLDRYAWLRDASLLPAILIIAGSLMVVTGGLFSAFQHHLGRIMGYATIVETGFSLLALVTVSQTGVGAFLILLIPRALSLCLWAICLSILRRNVPGFNFKDVIGIGHNWPFVTSGLFLTNLSLAGLPLLAGFPAHQAVWNALAHRSLPLTIWVIVGSMGLFISAIRVLGTLTKSPKGTNWTIKETPAQRFFVAVGLLALLLLGLFPQWVLPIWANLPASFERLVQ